MNAMEESCFCDVIYIAKLKYRHICIANDSLPLHVIREVASITNLASLLHRIHSEFRHVSLTEKSFGETKAPACSDRLWTLDT